MWNRIITIFILLIMGFTAVRSTCAQTIVNNDSKPSQSQQLSDWLLVNTQHFAVVSNTDPERAKLIAYKLEQYRYIFSLLSPNLVAASPAFTRVHVYRDGSSYSTGVPQLSGQVVSGYFQPGSDLISINDLFNITDNVSYHEYTHLLAHADENYPIWFSEGIAEFYETFEVFDHKARIGEVNSSRLHLLKVGDFIPIKKILNFRAYSQVLKETSLDLFYAESWLLTHYLMMDDERRAKLVDFLHRQNTGQSVETAFKEVFQIDFEQLEENLKSYLAVNKYKVFVFNFDNKQVDSDIEIISLSEEDKLSKLKELPSNQQLTITLKSRTNELRIGIVPNFSLLASSLDVKCLLSDRPLDLSASNPEQSAKTKEALERFNIANQLMEDSKKDAALSEYEKVIKLDSEFAPAYMQIGNIYSEKKEYDLARLAYEKARSVAPNYAGTYLNLAVSQYEEGRSEEAETSFRTALSLYPSSAASHLGLGNIYLQRKDYSQARTEFTKTLNLVRGKGLEALNAHIGLGAVSFYQSLYEKAKEHYQAAIKLDPRNNTWHRAYGDSCLMLKQYDQAKVAYLRAIELNSKDDKAQAGLQWIEKNDEYLRLLKQRSATKPKTEPTKN